MILNTVQGGMIAKIPFRSNFLIFKCGLSMRRFSAAVVINCCPMSFFAHFAFMAIDFVYNNKYNCNARNDNIMQYD
ncbi:hypothetical protein SAMN05661012_01395 [Chitinophaga sancti]|uniref:Uncharacterized protein n=1 Tax=Chitinophaga sancti TaxID=1004 RepID=A0A1K1NQH2_9BACT|nr:hypothetical protein SAMN05661012_01395 [Chitinophaga sancti]